MTDESSEREEGAGFRVTDRRRAGRDEAAGAQEAAAPPGGAPPGPAGEQGEVGARAEEGRPVSVPDLVRLVIAELHARAWVHMGLIVDPATKRVARDLSQARLAIDCVGALVEQVGPHVERAERAELERMLADLRINFVRQSGS